MRPFGYLAYPVSVCLAAQVAGVLCVRCNIGVVGMGESPEVEGDFMAVVRVGRCGMLIIFFSP